MLMDQDFADTVRAIGDTSLTASDEEIWHLVKVYWYTVEFGVVREEIERHPKGFESLTEYPVSPNNVNRKEEGRSDEKIYEYRAFGAGWHPQLGGRDAEPHLLCRKRRRPRNRILAHGSVRQAAAHVVQ